MEKGSGLRNILPRATPPVHNGERSRQRVHFRQLHVAIAGNIAPRLSNSVWNPSTPKSLRNRKLVVTAPLTARSSTVMLTPESMNGTSASEMRAVDHILARGKLPSVSWSIHTNAKSMG